MTRHTDTIRRGKVRLVLEARTERDESSSYRHKWRTEVTFGLLRASGPNAGAAVEALLAEITALANSEAAGNAFAREMHVKPCASAEAQPNSEDRFPDTPGGF